MPAVTESQKRDLRVSRRQKKLGNYIRELMMDGNKTQADCAAILGITQAGFSFALKRMSFSVYSLITLLDFLGADPAVVSTILARSA